MYWYNFVLFVGLVHILPITLCILEDEIALEKIFQMSCLNFSAINDENLTKTQRQSKTAFYQEK